MIRFRPGQPEDAASIVSLFKEYRRKSLGVARVRRNLRDFPSVLACSDGALVGFCYCLRFAPDILEIANIYVSKNHRNDGIGELLISELEARTDESVSAFIAVNSLRNQSLEKKIKPTNFYNRNGFRILYENSETTVYLKELRSRL